MTNPSNPAGVFDGFEKEFFKYRFEGTLFLPIVVGGTPSDPSVAEGWIKTKTSNTDDTLRELVAQTMVERGITADEAAAEVAKNRHLNGFKRDPEHGLYIEGRQLKSAIREAASVAACSGNLDNRGWGKTNRGIQSWVAEHIFVEERRLYLRRPEASEAIHEADGVAQRFIATWRGTGIQYEEYVENCEVAFTVVSDHEFTAKQWAALWLTGQKQGLGASRSQGFGTYKVTSWEKVKAA